MINKTILTRALKHLREMRGQSNISQEELDRCNFCITIIAKMERDYHLLEKEICPYSYLYFGKNLEDALNNFSSVSNEIYISCAKFTREMLLYYERIKDVPPDLEEEWNNFLNDRSLLNNNFYNIEKDILINGRFDIDVINSHLGNRFSQAFLNYEKKLKKPKRNLKNSKKNQIKLIVI